MTSRATFGDFIRAADQHLDQAPGMPRAQVAVTGNSHPSGTGAGKVAASRLQPFRDLPSSHELSTHH